MTPESVTVRKDDLRLLMEYAGKDIPADDSEHEVNVVLARCGEALAGAESGTEGSEPIHLGEYARVDIMGHDWKIGFVSNGSLAGASCLDVRDASGRLVAKIPPHSVYLYSPLAPPRPGEARAALPAGDEDSLDGACICRSFGESDADCPEHGWGQP